MTVEIEIGAWQPGPAVTGRTVFAIGDVHGRDDLYSALLSEIDDLASREGIQDPLVVSLGDFIDRGPHGIRALNRALDSNGVVLPGNHEQFLHAFLSAKGGRQFEIMYTWLDNGGDAVARELGHSKFRITPSDFAETIKAAIGEERLQRFLTLKNHFRTGGYLFVHAGIHPELGLKVLERDWRTVPETWAEDDDPLWIRSAFLTHNGSFPDGLVVVHGHTPRDGVELKANRINVDTRAYESGRLSAVQLKGDQLRFIQTVGVRSP